MDALDSSLWDEKPGWFCPNLRRNQGISPARTAPSIKSIPKRQNHPPARSDGPLRARSPFS
jgi:hypothetical protein